VGAQVLLLLMVVRGLRVVGWGCRGLFPTCAAGCNIFPK